MKPIKKYFSSILIIFLILMASCSEDFLNQDPQTSLSSEQLFASLDNIQPFLDGIYFKMRDTRINRKGFFLMLGSDESQQGEYQVTTDADQAALDKYNGFYEPNNKPIAELWNIRWPVVVKSAEALNYLEGMLGQAAAEDTARIKSFIGQAAFYRGLVMFELATYWGKLPVPEVNGKDIILSGMKSPLEIYTMIEGDLQKAAVMLDKKSSSEDIRIPTRWAAKALLGKMYMSAPAETGLRDYQKAMDQFQDIVDHGGFSLAPGFPIYGIPLSHRAGNLFLPIISTISGPIPMKPSGIPAQGRARETRPTTSADTILSFPPSTAGQTGVWAASGKTGTSRKNESIRYNFVNGNNFPSMFAGFGEDQLLPHIKKYEDIRIDRDGKLLHLGEKHVLHPLCRYTAVPGGMHE